MKTLITGVLATFGLVGMAGSAHAQNAPPSYQADPTVYKVIFEDQNFRVISVDRPAGYHDKGHSHLKPGIVYFVTDCSSKVSTPNGKTALSLGHAGEARASPIVAEHSVENTGSAACKQLLVERK